MRGKIVTLCDSCKKNWGASKNLQKITYFSSINFLEQPTKNYFYLYNSMKKLDKKITAADKI